MEVNTNMPEYTFVARGRDGSKEKGKLTASSRGDLADMLKSRGLTMDTSFIKEKGQGGLKSLFG